MGGGCVKLALTIQFLTSGLCSKLSVEYHPHICAVKGSSVVIPCTFHYRGILQQQEVIRVMWGHERHSIYKGPFIFDSKLRNTATKFQYIGDKRENCTFKINQVEHKDKGKYYFRFIINDKKDKFTGPGGSRLNVTDLHISVDRPVGKGQVKEGESARLTCTNSCDGAKASSAISWFKDGGHVKEGPALLLNNLTSNSSGSYACSLKNEPGTLSGVLRVSVGYGPNDTSVSVTPSTRVDSSGNITLTCRSNANPPVENYTWFAITDGSVKAVGHEAELILTAVSVRGDGGKYFCSVTNKHGRQNSSTVTLETKEQPTHSTQIPVIAAVAVFLIVVFGIAIVRLVKKIMGSPKNENMQNPPTYVNWPYNDNNQSQDRKEPERRPTEVTYATVHIVRKANTEQQMDSNQDLDVIYSEVNRSLISNPLYVQQH